MAAWDLSVSVEELGPEAPPIKISVTSDLHIGGVILKIVEKTRKLYIQYHTSCMAGRVQQKTVLYKHSNLCSKDYKTHMQSQTKVLDV